ncbi:MAG TPA: MBL fold metallo-hydrolase [Verrucomicrobiae bacterium]|nr:MBL fold metallo-hydrolase [Verrucomicrobiae bacterium]
MKVTIHRGSRQIGGSCIEIAAGRSRIILDAGLPLETGMELPKGRKEVLDLNVPGLFAPGPPVDAVLLSHAHPDHSGLLASRRAEIPVCMTGATSRILTSLYLFARGDWIGERRTLPEHEPVVIEDCTVTAMPVDHSIAGACAFLIEAEGKRILYSGDLRLHGRKPGMAKRVVEVARRGHLDLLIIEGTRLCPADAEATSDHYLRTEKEVEVRLVELIRTTGGLVLACFGPTNIDRLVSFFRAAVNTGRQLALDAYASHVLHMLKGIGRGGLPDPMKCDKIRLLPGSGATPAKSGGGTKAFLDRMRRKIVMTEEIYANPNRFVAIARPSSLGRDFPHGLPPNTLAVYSMWSGYRDKAEWRDFTAAVDATGGRVEECHTSGHIHPDDLRSLIGDLNPAHVVPVHTGFPEMFEGLWPNVRRAEDGVPFDA